MSTDAMVELITGKPAMIVAFDRQTQIDCLRDNLEIQQRRFDALGDPQTEEELILQRRLRKDIKTMRTTLKNVYKIQP